jgi:hypothetical protein
LNSYNLSAAKGSKLVRLVGRRLEDGCTFMIRIDLPTLPGFGKAYRSVKQDEHRHGEIQC